MLIHRIAALALIGSATVLTAVGCENSAQRDRDNNNNNTGAQNQQSANDPNKASSQTAYDKTQAQADQTQVKEQNDYRQKIQAQLSDDDKKMQDLQTSASNETGQSKTDADRLIGDVNAKRATLQGDLRQIDVVNTAQWQTLKQKIDDDLDAETKSIRTASTQITAAPGRARTGTTNTMPNSNQNANQNPKNPPPSQP